MRFPQAAHMPDDGHHGHGHGHSDHGHADHGHSAPAAASSSATDAPVWARRQGRSGGGAGIFGILFFLLAIFGILSIALAVMDKSFAAGGARIDGWIKPAVDQIAKMTGQAGAKAEDAAGDAAAEAAPAAAAPAAAAPAAAAPAADAAPAAPAKK
jgi:uncharacterized membrane protein